MPPRPRKSVIQLERRKISELLADPRNARKHDQKNLDTLRFSLRKYGQQKNIVVMPDGLLVAGHGTVEAAKLEGWDEVDVKVFEHDAAQGREYGLIDNRSGELSDWDRDLLRSQLDELDDDLRTDLGWDDSDWEKLAGGESEDELDTSPGLGEMEYRIIVECTGETQQRDLLERLEKEGFDCRAVMS